MTPYVYPISVITPTIGRSTLRAMLTSLDMEPCDEWIIVGDGPRPDASHLSVDMGLTIGRQIRYLETPTETRNYGHAQRTLGMAHARGGHLLFMDDDDIYLPGARAMINQVITRTPLHPILCRISDRNGATLWHTPEVRLGNVSTQMIILPNAPRLFGRWENGAHGVRGGDHEFIRTLGWPPEQIVWAPEVIAQLRPVGPWNDREFFYRR